jgi:hypothetical protein
MDSTNPDPCLCDGSYSLPVFVDSGIGIAYKNPKSQGKTVIDIVVQSLIDFFSRSSSPCQSHPAAATVPHHLEVTTVHTAAEAAAVPFDVSMKVRNFEIR